MVQVMMKVNDPAKAREYFMDKLAFTTGPVELNRMIQQSRDSVNVIDVRAAEDYEQGHVPGAINLPHERWQTLEGLSKDKQNVVYCYSVVCHLATAAAAEFAGKGYPVMELDGGWDEWVGHNLPIEK